MSYALSTKFQIDATGRPIATQGMEAAARYYRAHNLTESERCCRELIEHDPRHFDALHLLGVVHLDRAQFTDAVTWLTRATQQRPDDAQVNYHLGTAQLGLKLYNQAETTLQRALATRPDDAGTLNNLGNALAGNKKHAAAIECFQQVQRLTPGHTASNYNMGRALAELDRLDDAVASFQAALLHAPVETEPGRMADIHAALGQAFVALGRYDEARAECHAIAATNPGVAKWNESLVLLLLGQYKEGWRKYEGRWQVKDHDPPRAGARIPTLTEVVGKRVLLIAEQGHGDMIQFARYAPLLAAQGAKVSVQTYIELQPLMLTLQRIETVVAATEPEPAADIVTPLLSLPLMFGTDLATVPSKVPYLHAPREREAAWQQRLGAPTRRRIGLAWWGSQHIAKRSLPVETLLPILSTPNTEFHALQKEMPPAHREFMAAHPTLIDHSAELADFADTAALISQLDLVVTIDTAVAHLAGALGKPVWIMLQHNADWRWLLDRTDSPWYPTARLFRQKRAGDWKAVVSSVARALRPAVKQPRARARK
jgi:tetratricopeptide (TPR) repeat protein